eukprot:1147675-Pelagomonas_calceolata.AAC.4
MVSKGRHFLHEAFCTITKAQGGLETAFLQPDGAKMVLFTRSARQTPRTVSLEANDAKMV